MIALSLVPIATADDVFGSPGVIRSSEDGAFTPDETFALQVQVTGRAAVSSIMAAYARDLFWDGRAMGEFVDPETGDTIIPLGGGLESQAVGPIMSDVEMAHENRDWDNVRTRLVSPC